MNIQNGFFPPSRVKEGKSQFFFEINMKLTLAGVVLMINYFSVSSNLFEIFKREQC
jgi:hypothetical protein